MTLMELFLLGIGALLIWSGIGDRNPVQEIKSILIGASG